VVDFDLNEILQSHEGYMLTIAGKYLGWNNSDMDDVIQESRISICKSISTYVGEKEHIRKWIGGVVYNHCISHIRKIKRRIKHEQEAGNQMSKKYEPDDFTDEINSIINKLSEVEKFIVKRHFFDGQSYETIAKELNQNVNRIRTKIFRKFNKIRNTTKIY
jgi:RNA polymerase sigma-70 factor (ECF subfamily)